MNTFEHEPIEGLPETLPPGEEIIWQGKPNWRNLARYTFRVPLIAGYFAFFAALRGVYALADGASVTGAIASTALVVPLALVGLGILAVMAWAHARTTVYTITNRRVVMRFGIAIPMIINLPFKTLISAEFKERKNGEGDIPLRLGGGTGPGYVHLWPHVRPWRISRPEPMLRGIPNVGEVAQGLARALIAFREAGHAAWPTEPGPTGERPGRTRSSERPPERRVSATAPARVPARAE